MKKLDDPVKRFNDAVPGLVAAINQIANKGFFGGIEVKIGSFEGKLNMLYVAGNGYIPSDQKYMTDGVKPMVNVPTVLRKIRCKVNDDKLIIRNLNSEIKSKDWQLWDKTGEKVIGKKGTEIEFHFSITFVF